MVRSYRIQIIRWITNMKREETRKRRFVQCSKGLEQNRKVCIT
ncbi:YdeI/OmpD-associated family protein [Candidatus Bathyarchaeota archaeon]|nr:YdeI/OmpD-associated family protein [Candidatus Bathyarchaeota archaeon]